MDLTNLGIILMVTAGCTFFFIMTAKGKIKPFLPKFFGKQIDYVTPRYYDLEGNLINVAEYKTISQPIVSPPIQEATTPVPYIDLKKDLPPIVQEVEQAPIQEDKDKIILALQQQLIEKRRGRPTKPEVQQTINLNADTTATILNKPLVEVPPKINIPPSPTTTAVLTENKTYIMYCFKCKAKQEIIDINIKKYDTAKGIKYLAKGKCKVCGYDKVSGFIKG